MSDVEVKFGGETSDLDAAAKKAQDDIEGVSNAAKRSGGGFDTLNSSNKQVVQGFKMTGYQSQILSYQLNDVFSGLLTGQKPFQVLMQQGPQITQIFGGLRATLGVIAGFLTPTVLAFGALAGALGVAGFAAVRYTLSQEALEKSTLGAGRAAGASGAQMQAMASDVAEAANVSTNAARTMAASFAQTGKVGVEMFDDLIMVSRDYQYAMGIDAKEATEELGEAMGDPIKGAEMLNDRMGLLNDTQTQLIRTMVEQGRVGEAQKLLLEAIAGATEGAAGKANGLAAAWHNVASATSNAIDKLGQYLALGGRGIWNILKEGGNVPAGINRTVNTMVDERRAADATAARNRATAEANRLSVQAGEAARALLPKEESVRRVQNQIVLLRRAAASGAMDEATATRAIAAANREIASLQAPAGGRGRGGRSAAAAAAREARERERAAEGALRVELATLDRQQAAVEDNLVEWTRIQDQKLDAIRAFHSEESTEYQRALQRKDEFTRRFEERREREEERAAAQARRLEQQRIESVSRSNEAIASADAQLASLQIDNAEQVLAQEQSRGQLSAAETLATQQSLAQARMDLEINLAERMYEIRRQALMDQLALAGIEADEMARINMELEQLEVLHQSNLRVIRATGNQQMTANNRMASDQVRATWQQNITGMTSSFTGMWTQWAAGIQAFRTGWQNFGRSILSVIETNLNRIVENWILTQLGMTTASQAGEAARTATAAVGSTTRTGITAGETAAVVGAKTAETGAAVAAEGAKTGATAVGAATRVGIETSAAATTTAVSNASALSQIAARAASAAAGAYSAIAAIPIIGPVLAPVSAAAALAGVLALGNRIFSARGGWGKVPHDGAMTELHKDEMVLPATFANPLREMLSGMSPGRTSALAGPASSAGAAARTEMSSKTLAPTFNFQPSLTGAGGAPQSLDRMLAAEGAAMRKWINNQVRSGKLKVA